MDYDLLAIMLENYKRLFIAHGREVGDEEEDIQYIVRVDIDPAIDWARRGAELEYETRREYE